MPSDMDHLHGTDTRDARIAELRAENERLRKELDVCEYVKRVDAAREDARKEAALEAILVVQSEPELLGDPPEGFDELVAKVGLIRSARALVKEVKACIQERLGQHFGLDAKEKPKVKIGEGGVVVVAPAGDSPLRELYESPEFRAAWANREEKQ